MTFLRKRFIAPFALAAGLGMAAAGTQAGEITFQGVTFTTSWEANILTLEIDAAGRTGDWAGANTLGALALKDLGSFDSVSMTAAPAGAMGWTLNTNELSANGCSAGSNPMKLCVFGSHIALSDDMMFKFTFNGGTPDLTSPFLKVAFYTGDGDQKVGSLLSQEIAPVPEPAGYGMLLAGLLAVGGVLRARKS
jgi:hypothetical protein